MASTTFQYFRNYVDNSLKLSGISDSEINQTIVQASIKATGGAQDMISADTAVANQLFYIPLRYIKDDTFIFYRSPDSTNILSPSYSLLKEEFSVNEQPYPVFSYPLQIDYTAGALRFQTPLDFTLDYVFYQCMYVDIDKFQELILSLASVTDRVTEETRSNVTIKRRSYMDILAERNNLQASAGPPMIELEVGTFSRLSGGVVHGVDSATGHVLP